MYLPVFSDINECAVEDQCKGENERCVNFPGGFECNCNDGYEKIGEKCQKKPKGE